MTESAIAVILVSSFALIVSSISLLLYGFDDDNGFFVAMGFISIIGIIIGVVSL